MNQLNSMGLLFKKSAVFSTVPHVQETAIRKKCNGITENEVI